MRSRSTPRCSAVTIQDLAHRHARDPEPPRDHGDRRSGLAHPQLTVALGGLTRRREPEHLDRIRRTRRRISERLRDLRQRLRAELGISSSGFSGVTLRSATKGRSSTARSAATTYAPSSLRSSPGCLSAMLEIGIRVVRCPTNAAGVGYACPEQRTTRILQPPRSLKSGRGGGNPGNSCECRRSSAGRALHS